MVGSAIHPTLDTATMARKYTTVHKMGCGIPRNVAVHIPIIEAAAESICAELQYATPHATVNRLKLVHACSHAFKK